MSDFFGGLVHGALSLFGMGSLVDPLGDAKSDLNDATQKMNQMTATESLQAAQGEQKELEELIQLMNVQKKEMGMISNYSQEMLWESLAKEQLFMSILGVIILLVVVFFLIQKKCC